LCSLFSLDIEFVGILWSGAGEGQECGPAPVCAFRNLGKNQTQSSLMRKPSLARPFSDSPAFFKDFFIGMNLLRRRRVAIINDEQHVK
jgi:hypothetical protein